MTTKTEINKSQPDMILNSLNPRSKDFNFELWAREVRLQMLTAFQKRLSSSQGKTSQ